MQTPGDGSSMALERGAGPDWRVKAALPKDMETPGRPRHPAVMRAAGLPSGTKDERWALGPRQSRGGGGLAGTFWRGDTTVFPPATPRLALL